MTRGTTWLASITLGLCSAACASDLGAATDTTGKNSCSEDAECGDGARCREGMCAMVTVDPFNVYLQVTPTQHPDGSEGRGIWLTPLRVDGPIGPEIDIEVPEPVPVHVEVTRDGAALEASIRFVEIPVATGLPVRERAVTHTDGPATLSLPNAARYEVVAEPTDRRWPPLRQVVEVSEDLDIAFDYDAVAISSRQFLLQGLAAGLDVSVRAVDSRSGNVVSSVYSEPPVAGAVTLTFAPGQYPYALEITPAPPADYEATDCNRSGIQTPSYRVALDEAGIDPMYEEDDADVALTMRPARFADDGATVAIALPQVQPLITYRGTVELCEGSGMAPSTVGSIPINLRSTHLLRPEEGMAIGDPAAAVAAVASFAASATAEFDPDAMKLQFCAAVLPGDYEVVATAPGSVDCGIFAEELLLKAPQGSSEKAGDSLVLASTASIEGNLSSALTEPIADATVEASPLARAEGINLADEDRGVTQYNRPRQTTTDDVGSFSLSLDVGAYDVTVKPPAASGLSWLIVHDVLIADRTATFSSALTATVPVPLEGNLVYASGADSASLAGAQLRAFTLVGEGDAMRTIEIGQSAADDDGHFVLRAPPTTLSGLWGDGTR